MPLYGSLAELFAKDRPDGVVIATPNQLHVEQGLECVAAKVPVLVEKPVGTHAGGGHPPVRGGRARGREAAGRPSPTAQPDPAQGRGDRAVRAFSGPLVGVIGSAVFYKPDAEGYYDGPNAWRKEPGGGPILINMIHEIGNLRAMVGEIVAVQAFASNATRGFEVEDTVAINLRFANGALGAFLLSDTAASPKSWEQTSQENKAYPTYEDEDAYTIVGTMGSLGVPTMRLKYYEKKEDRSWFKPFATRSVPLQREDPLALADRALRRGDPRRGRAARDLSRRPRRTCA